MAAEWVNFQGTPVKVDTNGKVVLGPKHLMGKKVQEAVAGETVQIHINGDTVVTEEFVRDVLIPALREEIEKGGAQLLLSREQEPPRRIAPVVLRDGTIITFDTQNGEEVREEAPIKRTFAEVDHASHIDFERIEQDLNTLEGKTVESLRGAMEEVRDNLVRKVERGFDGNPQFIKNLRIKSFRPVRVVVRGFLRDLFELGRKDIVGEQKEMSRRYGLEERAFATPIYTPREALRWMEGQTLQISSVLEDRVLGQAQQILLNAVKFGEPLPTTVGKLKELFDPYIGDASVLKDGEPLSAWRLETIVRTNSTSAYNAGRLVAARDPDLQGFIRGMLYSAVLDTRTTPVCRHLDGKIIPMDEPALDRLTPPMHYNCRSLLVSVPEGVGIDQYKFITQEEIGRALDLAGAGFV